MAMYALIVGVAAYEHRSLQPLFGPVRDAVKVEDWLRGRFTAENLHLHPLHNAGATKAAVVAGFTCFLTKAGQDDQCLFYFSGHGALETLPPLFERFDPGGLLETIVCYDSLCTASLLASKELRWLIHQVSLRCPNILVMMDSCHSGLATRNGEMGLKRLAGTFPPRDWADFIFPPGTAENLATAVQLIDVLPEGPHIQLAACEPLQSAYEVRGASIFTANLLQVLEQDPHLSYTNVYSRVKYLIANRFDQMPSMTIVGADPQEYGSRLFPGGNTSNDNGANANIVFNNPAKSWLLDKGAIHGLRTVSETFELPVYASPASDPVSHARITRILPDHSQLELQNAGVEKIAYSTFVPGLYRQPLNIVALGEEAGIAVLEHYYEANREHCAKQGIHLLPAEALALANYIVVPLRQSYSLVRPDEYSPGEPLLPLLKAVEGYTEFSARQVFNYLLSIVRWEFAKNLQHENTRIGPFPILLQAIYKQPNGLLRLEVPDETDTITACYQTTATTHLSVKLKLVNRSENPFYCAAVLLGLDFSINTRMLPGVVEVLAKAGMRELNDGNFRNFFLQAATKDYNRPYERYHLLLIASTERFEISAIQQEGLPLPVKKMRTRGDPPKGNARIPAENIPPADWSTRLIRIRLSNPFYKKPPEQTLPQQHPSLCNLSN